MYTGNNNCEGCRYWSDMIARAGGGTTNPTGQIEAMCLAVGPFSGKYTTPRQTCSEFARDTAGKIDGMPDYGEEARAEYERQALEKHPNGAPKYSRDGTLLDEKGNRSIFDDVDL